MTDECWRPSLDGGRASSHSTGQQEHSIPSGDEEWAYQNSNGYLGKASAGGWGGKASSSTWQKGLHHGGGVPGPERGGAPAWGHGLQQKSSDSWEWGGGKKGGGDQGGNAGGGGLSGGNADGGTSSTGKGRWDLHGGRSGGSSTNYAKFNNPQRTSWDSRRTNAGASAGGGAPDEGSTSIEEPFPVPIAEPVRTVPGFAVDVEYVEAENDPETRKRKASELKEKLAGKDAEEPWVEPELPGRVADVNEMLADSAKIRIFAPATEKFVSLDATGNSPIVLAGFQNLPDLPDFVKKNMLAQNWIKPMKIQKWAVVPAVFNGSDIVGLAKTGSGKTLAFLVPIVVHLWAHPENKALVMSPTRELANQTHGEFEKLTASKERSEWIWSLVCFGGVSKKHEAAKVARARFICGTPGRLQDWATQPWIDDIYKKKWVQDDYGSWKSIEEFVPHDKERPLLDLSTCSILVLDEADKMLEDGFDSTAFILANLMRPNKQTFFFTATWPEHVQKIAIRLMMGKRSPCEGSLDPYGEDAVKEWIQVPDEGYKKGHRWEEAVAHLEGSEDTRECATREKMMIEIEQNYDMETMEVALALNENIEQHVIVFDHGSQEERRKEKKRTLYEQLGRILNNTKLTDEIAEGDPNKPPSPITEGEPGVSWAWDSYQQKYVKQRTIPDNIQILLFVSEKIFADSLAEEFRRNGYIGVDRMHSGRDQSTRTHLINQFKAGEIRMLIATDVVSRGLDIPTVTHVVIYDYGGVHDYIHRVGRTARGEHGKGNALVFFEYWEKDPSGAAKFAAILREAGQRVPRGLVDIANEVEMGLRAVDWRWQEKKDAKMAAWIKKKYNTGS